MGLKIRCVGALYLEICPHFLFPPPWTLRTPSSAPSIPHPYVDDPYQVTEAHQHYPLQSFQCVRGGSLENYHLSKLVPPPIVKRAKQTLDVAERECTADSIIRVVIFGF